MKENDGISWAIRGKSNAQQMIAQIESGDVTQAVKLVRQIQADITDVQNCFILWSAYFLVLIQKNNKEDVDKAWADTLSRPLVNNTSVAPKGVDEKSFLQQITKAIQGSINGLSFPNNMNIVISDSSVLGLLREQSLKQLIAAIEQGKSAEAITLAELMDGELMWLHDLLLLWVTSFSSFIGKLGGDEAIADAWEQALKLLHTDNTHQNAKALSDEDCVEYAARGMTGHGNAYEFVENDHSYDFIVEQCRSGGTLIRAGAYEGDNPLYKMKGPSYATYEKIDLPSFCSHCALTRKVAEKDKDGNLRFELIASDNPGYGKCIARLYKQDDE